MVGSRLRTYAPSYGDLTLRCADFEEAENLRILGVPLYCKLTFETHLRKGVPKAARSQGVVRRVGILADCPRVLKSLFNAYVLCSLEYFVPCGYHQRSLISVYWTVLF